MLLSPFLQSGLFIIESSSYFNRELPTVGFVLPGTIYPWPGLKSVDVGVGVMPCCAVAADKTAAIVP